MTARLILLCAGGTGGHVFPARALAEELLIRGFRVAFAVDARGVKYLDGLEGVDIHVISAGPARGKIAFAASLLKGYLQSHRLIARLKPDLAVGFGGYPSAPPMLAAQHARIPTLIHDSNAVLGLANILLAPFVGRIALSYRKTKKMKPGWLAKSVFTGNPVREDIILLRDREFPNIETELNILIFGGSLGAKSFADIIPYAIINLAKSSQVKLQIAHQARDSDLDKVKKIYNDADHDAEIKSFFDNMPQRIETAHLMICRSGASTVAETTCAGRPAVYIPYPWHKDQQQLHNAEEIVSVGGGWLVEEKNLSVEHLSALLLKIMGEPDGLALAASRAKALGEPNALSLLADQAVAMIQSQSLTDA